MSWYDVSVGPNLDAFNHVRKTASPEIANQQWAMIAPVGHCAYKRATENTIVGERSMGDARLNYDEMTYGWFDHFLKGENILARRCRRCLLHDGHQQVAVVGHVAAGGRAAADLLLSSGGKANTMNGDGAAPTQRLQPIRPDTFDLRSDEPGAVLRRQRCAARETRSQRALSISERRSRGRISSSTVRSRSRKASKSVDRLT